MCAIARLEDCSGLRLAGLLGEQAADHSASIAAQTTIWNSWQCQWHTPTPFQVASDPFPGGLDKQDGEPERAHCHAVAGSELVMAHGRFVAQPVHFKAVSVAAESLCPCLVARQQACPDYQALLYGSCLDVR